MTKEVWVVVGTVTDPDSPFLGQPEYQFSNGPPGNRSGSEDYTSLDKGLAAHSGFKINWVGPVEIKSYDVKIRVRELRTIDGIMRVNATTEQEAVNFVRKLADNLIIHDEDAVCDEWELIDAWDARETE